jgi:hypothetical protein
MTATLNYTDDASGKQRSACGGGLKNYVPAQMRAKQEKENP